MNISGDAVKAGDEIKKQALGAIKSVLWFNTRFRATANAALSKSNVSGTTDERTLKATESFNLTFIKSNDTRGDPAPIWQLTGKPLSTNADLHKAIIKAIQAPKYWLNTHLLEVGKRLVECVWCKADTHPAHACPLPTTLDWAGPKPSTTSKNGSHIPQSDGHPKDNRGPRGGGPTGRGGRGRGRGRGLNGGPASQRGWTCVTYRP